MKRSEAIECIQHYVEKAGACAFHNIKGMGKEEPTFIHMPGGPEITIENDPLYGIDKDMPLKELEALLDTIKIESKEVTWDYFSDESLLDIVSIITNKDN